MKRIKKHLTVLMVMTILFSMLSVSTASAATYINTFTVTAPTYISASTNLDKKCTVQMATSNAYSVGLTIYIEKEDPTKTNLFTVISSKTKSIGGLPTSFKEDYSFTGAFDKGIYRFKVVAYVYDKNGNVLQSDLRTSPTFSPYV